MTSEVGFYFHLMTPTSIDRGLDVILYANFEAAYLDALAAIPALSADLLSRGVDPMECSFLLCDSGDSLVETIHFREVLRPARQGIDCSPDILLPAYGKVIREQSREVRAQIYFTRMRTRALIAESRLYQVSWRLTPELARRGDDLIR